jgi:hypothetical protein
MHHDIYYVYGQFVATWPSSSLLNFDVTHIDDQQMMEYESQHEAHKGGCARIHTAMDACSQVGCGLVMIRLKYGLYFFVVSIVFVLPQSSLGGQIEYHYL